MDILVSNHSLKKAGGTETFTYTLIGELVRRGHNVELFCIDEGFYSDKIIEDFEINFISKKKYDLILANHCTTVKEIYKKGFTIQTCHGIFPQLEKPSPKADGYVAISQEIQNHLLSKGYLSRIIYNGIDCDRFKTIIPLRVCKPKVLSLCHTEDAHSTIKKACAIAEFDFGILDKYKDNKWDVEKVINNYDIVIGLGRSAYEALACGRPVIFFDKRNYSEQVGDGYFLEVMIEGLKNNCSGRALKINFTPDELANELKKYKPEHGLIARNYAYLSFNIINTVDDYLDHFENLTFLKKENSIKSKASKITKKIFSIKG